jgi:hypothetical protein
MILRTKLDESPLYVRYNSGGSSSLVRIYIEGITEYQGIIIKLMIGKVLLFLRKIQ